MFSTAADAFSLRHVFWILDYSGRITLSSTETAAAETQHWMKSIKYINQFSVESVNYPQLLFHPSLPCPVFSSENRDVPPQTELESLQTFFSLIKHHFDIIWREKGVTGRWFQLTASLNASAFRTDSVTVRWRRWKWVLLCVLAVGSWALVVLGINFKTSRRVKVLPAAPNRAVNFSLGDTRREQR